MPYAIRYHFSQNFAVSAQEAYTWCTGYQPNDHALTGNPNAKRTVAWLTQSTVILKETFPTSNGTLEKEKLVHLYPDQLMWVSTHLTGPNKYSQFLYQITVEGAEASRLDFTALHIEHKVNISPKELEALSDELCRGDSQIWMLLAAAMKKELKP
jgi:hypothetical protein